MIRITNKFYCLIVLQTLTAIYVPFIADEPSSPLLRSGISWVVRDARTLYVNTRWCWLLVLCVCLFLFTFYFPTHIIFTQRITQVCYGATLNGRYSSIESNLKYIFNILGVRSLANASRARQFNPLNPLGWGGYRFFKQIWQPWSVVHGRAWWSCVVGHAWACVVVYLSAHACQIWARSDGRIENFVFQIYK